MAERDDGDTLCVLALRLDIYQHTQLLIKHTVVNTLILIL